MKVPASPAFEQDRERFRLRFTCEHCAHFAAVAERCSFGFPCEEHREAAYVWPYREVVFCKAFELG